MKAEGGNFYWKSYKAFTYSSESEEYELTLFRILGKKRT